MIVFPDRCHAVQVCDIVAISKAKDERGNSQKNVKQLYPHAFTGRYKTFAQIYI